MKLKNQKINIAIVGCGRVAEHYYKIFKIGKISNINIAGVCDKKLQKAKLFASKYKSEWFTSLEKMLNSLDIDLLIICTSSGLHYSHAKKSLKKNINVLVEKPICLNFKQAQKLDFYFKKKNLNLFVVKQNRFNKTLIIFKELIEKNLLGKIYLVNLNLFLHRPQKYYDMDNWKGTKKLDGGALFNQASHHFDILTWLFGSSKSVDCTTSTIARNIQTEDTAIINLKNKNNILISANISVLSYKKNYECNINIISEKANIKIGGPALNKFEHLDALNIDKIKKIFNKYNYKIDKIFNYGHDDVYKSLANDLKKGTKTCPTSNNTLESIRLIENCYKSSKHNKKIFIY